MADYNTAKDVSASMTPTATQAGGGGHNVSSNEGRVHYFDGTDWVLAKE